METRNCDECQIFLCNDKCPSNEYGSKHNYLILSIDDSNGKLGLVQCMAITSMTDKDVVMEVPIKLSNDMISYIVPYNIHSFMTDEFSIQNYKGCIKDTEYCSKEEFLKLLMDIYLDILNIGAVDHKDVMDRYNKYCSDFWNRQKNFKEFRESEDKQHQKDLTQKIINKHIKNQHTNDAYKRAIKAKYDSNKAKKAKRKDDKRQQKEIEKSMRDAIGKTSKNTNDNKNNKIKEINNTNIIPRNKEEIILDDMKVLENTSKLVHDWSDEHIILFIKGYKKFGFKKINSILPMKWKYPASMTRCYNVCINEVMKRNLKKPPILMLKQMKKPIVKWSDNEVRYYLYLMNNHKADTSFLLEVTGFESVNQCNQKTYQVKEEAIKRKLLKR